MCRSWPVRGCPSVGYVPPSKREPRTPVLADMSPARRRAPCIDRRRSEGIHQAADVLLISRRSTGRPADLQEDRMSAPRGARPLKGSTKARKGFCLIGLLLSAYSGCSKATAQVGCRVSPSVSRGFAVPFSAGRRTASCGPRARRTHQPLSIRRPVAHRQLRGPAPEGPTRRRTAQRHRVW